VIGQALGVDLTHSAEVKEADNRMMATEVRDLMPAGFNSAMWGLDIGNPVGEIIHPWGPSYSEAAFLGEYNDLRSSVC